MCQNIKVILFNNIIQNYSIKVILFTLKKIKFKTLKNFSAHILI